MTIEILFFAGCPYAQAAFDRVREVVRELGLDVEIRHVEVTDDADAFRQRFLGSPTVRVDGVDIEPGAGNRTDYSLTCRLYAGDGEIPRVLIRQALEEAIG